MTSITQLVSEAGRHAVIVSAYSDLEFAIAKKDTVVMCNDATAIRKYGRANSIPYEERRNWTVLVAVNGDLIPFTDATDPDSLASLRVRLAKGRRRDMECIACLNREIDCSCKRCWSGVCRTCFVKAQLHASSLAEYTCPMCRMPQGVEALTRTIVAPGTRMRISSISAIRYAMLGLGETRTQLSLEAVDLRSGDLHRRILAVYMAPSGRIILQTPDHRLVKRSLDAQGTRFAVGEVPTSSKDERDLWRGRMYIVDRHWSTIEVTDGFSLFATRVRAWSAHALGT